MALIKVLKIYDVVREIYYENVETNYLALGNEDEWVEVEDSDLKYVKAHYEKLSKNKDYTYWVVEKVNVCRNGLHNVHNIIKTEKEVELEAFRKKQMEIEKRKKQSIESKKKRLHKLKMELGDI